MTKIFIIGPTPPPYHGVAVSTRMILTSPILQRFQVIHLDTADRRSIENIGTFELGNVLIGLWHAFKFLVLLIRHRPKLVYLPISQGVGGYLRDLTFLLPCRWLGVRTVIHLRGSEFRTFYQSTHPVMKTLIRHSLISVRRVIVLGENLRGVFDGLVPAARVSVVPNGTDDFASKTGRADKKPNVIRGLFLGNLRPRKGFFITLEAAIKALQCFPRLEFSFAGDWASQEVQEQAYQILEGSQVKDRLHFLGVVVGEQKNRLLLESDFFVFPPIEPEGHPRVVLEAMAAGLPMITTGQGAIVETVVEGETGYLVEPGNAEAIVEKITYWMEHPEAMRAMGQAARQRFLTHYTAEASNQRLAAIFTEVLGEP